MPGMESWADQTAAILRADYGDKWDIWYVPRHMVGYSWHARPKGTETAAVNGDSPEELEENIAEYEKSQK